MLIDAAIKSKKSKIVQENVAPTLKKYSIERVDDISKETIAECAQLKEIIRTFANLKFDRDGFKASADVIMNHLVKLPSQIALLLENLPR